MAENPLMFRWLTVGGNSRAQCLHKYIDGYDIRLSPMFDSKVFNEFDIKGHEPWEQAVALGIERARAPISRIDVDPKRVVIIYRSRTNITSEVITWGDKPSDVSNIVNNAMRWLLSRISKFNEMEVQMKAPAELTRIILGETLEDIDGE